MNRNASIFSLRLDGGGKVILQMSWDKKDKYVINVIIKDKKLLLLTNKKKIKGNYKNLKNKSSFLTTLKRIIDSLIIILQKAGYKLFFNPEVSLFDLENIAIDF